MANFDISFEITSRNEGGYTKDPHETWMGIDRAEQPGWEGWSIVDTMKGQSDFPHCLSSNNDLLRSVRDFFRVHFWQPVKGDEITAQEVADKLYDAGVNMGVGTAIRLMQGALGLTVDGIVGPHTIEAMNGADPADALSRFKDLRIAHYKEIVENHPEDEKYLDSWVARC